MLDKPFSGFELYVEYEFNMGRTLRDSDHTNEWDFLGKTKKQAWNNLAKLINERMRSESNFIRGEATIKNL